MGRKVNPIIFRMGVLWSWNSKWFARKDFAVLARQDIQIRKMIGQKFRDAGISVIEIERTSRMVRITIHAAKPGLVIGRGGVGAEDMKKRLKKEFLNEQNVELNIIEVAQPNLSAPVVAQFIVAEIEKRVPFRRVMKQAIDRVQKAGAQGVRVMMSGRLDGAEIARRELLSWGKVPLHTLRANIDYSRIAAFTTYGAIGIKVWIYKGDVFEKKKV